MRLNELLSVRFPAESTKRMVGCTLSNWPVMLLATAETSLTSIENDELVLVALKKYQSILEFAPGSAGARDFRRLADAITNLPEIGHASGGLQFFMERLVKQKAGA